MSIPTGDLRNVENSETDFLRKITGKDIKLVQGLCCYDHNYCIFQKNDSINLAAEIIELYKEELLT